MRAAIFNGVGRPLEVGQIPDPECEPGGLILKVHYCGVCGSDLHATQQGLFVAPTGGVLGHEFAGEVVESRAAGWKVGELATAVPVKACNACRTSPHAGECRDSQTLGVLCPNYQLVGFSTEAQGGYAQYIQVSAAQAFRLPAAVSARHGATAEPLAIGLHAVEMGRVKLGDRVLVIGSGPIGLAVTAFAKLAGAAHVLVSEYAPIRRNTALAFGASATIDPAKSEVGESFARIAGGAPDVIFECVGVPGMVQQCIDLSAPRGRVVVVGVCMQEDKVLPVSAILKEVNLQFVLGYGKPNWRLVLDLLERKGLDPEPMITRVITLDELPAEFEALRKPSTQIKLLVDPRAAALQ